MSKHTNGPWSFHCRDTSKPLIKELVGKRRLTGGGFDILGITVEKYGPDDTEAEANARLIAAAPELLDILEAFIDPISATMELRVKALAIIKKAKGKE